MNALATINDSNVIEIKTAEGVLDFPRNKFEKTLKSGAVTFITQKDFREACGLGNSEAKRLYAATRNAVGDANRKLMSAIINDSSMIGTKIHKKDRAVKKDGKEVGRKFTGYTLELTPLMEIPAEKAEKAKPLSELDGDAQKKAAEAMLKELASLGYVDLGE